MLIGTAGHVNHGKTSLIRALTGVDTDRLPEEKRRGLSIDLGFAYLERPGGEVIGFVDVPGHDRYLHNMISGVLPLDSILLVVAADAGVQQQTREHLEILDLVGIRQLTVAITRVDRADDAMIAQTEAQLREALSRTSFAEVQFIRVSSVTGAGLDDLQRHLDTLGIAPGNTGAHFRLPVDRAFTLQGIGVVVTGTIVSGTVHVGNRLVLSPSGLGARVRSLHAQNRGVMSASVGVRCALAISGPDIEKSRIARGDMLVARALQEPSERIGVRLKLADGVSLRQGAEMQLYHGTGRTAVKLRLADDAKAGDIRLAELHSAEPIAALHGDRILLRDEIAKRNVAGGIVIDPFLPGRAISRDARATRLAAASHSDHAAALTAQIDATGFADFKRFCRARNLDPTAIQLLSAHFAENLIMDGDAAIILSTSIREDAKKRLVGGVNAYHQKFPHVLGPRRDEALAFMGKALAGSAAQACLSEAIREELLVSDGACIRLKAHRPHLAAEDQAVWESVHELMRRSLRPPHIGALAQALALPFKDAERALIRFEKFGLLTRVTRNRFFLPETIDSFRDMANSLAQESDESGFTAADFNRKAGIGRNLTIEILEYLDRVGATKRVGQRRHVI